MAGTYPTYLTAIVCEFLDTVQAHHVGDMDGMIPYLAHVFDLPLAAADAAVQQWKAAWATNKVSPLADLRHRESVAAGSKSEDLTAVDGGAGGGASGGAGSSGNEWTDDTGRALSPIARSGTPLALVEPAADMTGGAALRRCNARTSPALASDTLDMLELD